VHAGSSACARRRFCGDRTSIRPLGLNLFARKREKMRLRETDSASLIMQNMHFPTKCIFWCGEVLALSKSGGVALKGVAIARAVGPEAHAELEDACSRRRRAVLDVEKRR
jgi:hypothetical protein